MPGIDNGCEGPARTHHMACDCREDKFRAAAAKLKACQDIMTSYLPPDGISQEDAIDQLLLILDGPEAVVLRGYFSIEGDENG